MNVYLNCNKHEMSYQLISSWFAYTQHLGKEYISKVSITESEDANIDVSILVRQFHNLPTVEEISKYKIILICNGGEPLEVFNSGALEMLTTYPNVYLIANSLVSDDHFLKSKILWFPRCVQNCRDHWTRRFYPQYHDYHVFKHLPRTKMLSGVNGANRANRYYFFRRLRNEVPNINLTDRYGDTEIILKDCQVESIEDTTFRVWVNKFCELQTKNSLKSVPMSHFEHLDKVGINGEFGGMAIGDFLLPAYFDSHYVVFPETSWINDQLCLTEKALKCFYAGSLPFPIAGSNVNYLYNKMGFYTAWNLLPKELQVFDQERDHVKRYGQMIESIKWLDQNYAVAHSEQFKSMTQHNLINFLTFPGDYQSTVEFDKIVRRYVNC